MKEYLARNDVFPCLKYTPLEKEDIYICQSITINNKCKDKILFDL